jgi:hypothetical protein
MIERKSRNITTKKLKNKSKEIVKEAIKESVPKKCVNQKTGKELNEI